VREVKERRAGERMLSCCRESHSLRKVKTLNQAVLVYTNTIRDQLTLLAVMKEYLRERKDPVNTKHPSIGLSQRSSSSKWRRQAKSKVRMFEVGEFDCPPVPQGC
jgi:hypothetical protein